MLRHLDQGALASDRVVIVDPVTRRPCGPDVARGYWQAPAATERTFGAMPARAVTARVQPQEDNVVELSKGVLARPQRASQ